MSDDLRLRATVDDKATGPIRDIGRAVRQVAQSGSIAPLSREFAGLHGVLSTVGRELRFVTLPTLGALGVGGGVIASLVGVSKALAKLADKTLDLRYLSKELGFASNEIKAFGAAAEHFRIDPGQAAGGLRAFSRNVGDIKHNLSGVRDELLRHGAGDVVAALRRSKSNYEALGIAIERMELMRKSGNEFGAQRFAELMFGDAVFARMTAAEIKKRLGMFGEQTKEQIEAAEKYAESVNRIGNAFERLKNKVGGTVLPYIAAPAEGLADFLEQKKAPPPSDLVQKQKRIEAIERQLAIELNPVQGNRLRDEREKLTREIESLRESMKKLREETDGSQRGKKMSFTGPPTESLPIIRTSYGGGGIGGVQQISAPSIVGPAGGRYAPPSLGDRRASLPSLGGEGDRGARSSVTSNPVGERLAMGANPMGALPSIGKGVENPLGNSRSSDAMRAMMDQLRKDGVPEGNLKHAAAALTGQAIAESNLNPNASHDGGTGFGIYGARNERSARMLGWLRENGYAPNSLQGQSAYMAHEAMTGGDYAASRKALMGATSDNLASVTDTLTRNFERPAINNVGARLSAAVGALNRFDNRDTGVNGAIRELQGSIAAIRRQTISPELRRQLDYAAKKSGVVAEITSGGQAGIGEGGPRTGSTRHDHGGAADLRLRDPETGRVLDMRVGEDVRRMRGFVRDSVAAGATGVGAGLGYMGPNTMHIGGGRPSVWGGADWIRDAWREGRESPVDRSAIDRALAAQTGKSASISGSASIKVDVNAPKGTKVGVGYGGIFKEMEMTRSVQMEPSAEGPRAGGI